MKLLKIACGIAALLCVILTTGCATNKNARVIQLESGRIEVLASAEKQSDAAIAAVDAADKYCEERNKEAVFSDTGNDTAKNRDSKALKVMKNLPVVGRVLAASEEDATLRMSFRCR